MRINEQPCKAGDKVRLCANCVHCSKMPPPVGVRPPFEDDYWCSRFKKVTPPSRDDCPVHVPYKANVTEHRQGARQGGLNE
jgi:hypothetical protein